MKILIADDHEATRRMMTARLKIWGHECLAVGDGLQAWNELQRHSIGLVISDWNMPELDGVELCRKVRSADLGRYIYLILCTGRGEKADLIAGRDAGADDFLSKPVDFDELRVAIDGASRVIELEARLREQNEKLSRTNKELELAYSTIQRDMRAAADLQRELLPKSADRIDGVETDWFFIPAAFLAGDIFHFHKVATHQIAFYHLDVSGHGTASALLSVSLNRLLFREDTSSRADEITAAPPNVVLQRLNDRFQDLGDMYFTIVYGVFDLEQRQICFAQAGHPNPIIMTANGDVREVGQGGFPVGLMSPMDYELTTIPFHSGDQLCLYSDGVLDCHNEHGEAFGLDRLLSALQNSRSCSVKGKVAQIELQVREWRGGRDFEDDLSMLVFAAD